MRVVCTSLPVAATASPVVPGSHRVVRAANSILGRLARVAAVRTTTPESREISARTFRSRLSSSRLTSETRLSAAVRMPKTRRPVTRKATSETSPSCPRARVAPSSRAPLSICVVLTGDTEHLSSLSPIRLIAHIHRSRQHEQRAAPSRPLFMLWIKPGFERQAQAASTMSRRVL